MSKVNILDIHDFEEQEKLVDFYCNQLPEHLIAHNKAISVPHKHNFFLTVFFTQGSGIHEVDFEQYTVGAGSVFMLNPGQTHYWELSADTDGIIFFHSQAFFELPFTKQSIFDFPFFYSVLNPSALFLEKENQASILSIFQHLLTEYQQSQAFSKQKIIALLNCLYIDLSRIYLQTHDNKVVRPDVYSGYLRTLESLIEEHFKTKKSPAIYAEMLNISPRHLNRLTQENLGKSTTTLITERVILEAKRLIVYDPNSLANISLQLGYEDYAYFSRLFKKWTGLKPSEFGMGYRNP